MLSRTLESGVNALPLGKTNFPCRFSVTRTLVLGCLSNNALAASLTMNEKDQKIIHRWDYLRERSTWTTQSSKNIAKVLDHLKLGLDGETALNRTNLSV
jgi:hypothetical protein